MEPPLDSWEIAPDLTKERRFMSPDPSRTTPKAADGEHAAASLPDPARVLAEAPESPPGEATGSSESALLERARAGDRGALEQLLELHQTRVFRFGLKMCRDPEDAKDVLQDTLLAAARGVRDFRGASSLSTWLYTIARSFCIKKRRRGKFAPELETSLDESPEVLDRQVAGDPSGAEEQLAAREVERALEQAIQELEPMYRDVLVLRDAEGLTAPEVAEVLGLSIQAVKSRLHRARQAVRARMLPLLQVPDDVAPPSQPCPDVLLLFSQHLEDEISADVCRQMEQHLAGCPRCQATCDSLRKTLALCRDTTQTVVVPAKVQASVRVALRDFLGSTPG